MLCVLMWNVRAMSLAGVLGGREVLIAEVMYVFRQPDKRIWTVELNRKEHFLYLVMHKQVIHNSLCNEGYAISPRIEAYSTPSAHIRTYSCTSQTHA